MAIHRINSCPGIFRPSNSPVVSSTAQRKRNLLTFSTKMRYTKGPQIKQANRPTGLVRRRWRWRRRRWWAREGSSYVFLLRGVNRCSIESGIVILLLYDTLFLSSSWLFMTVTKFSLPIRLYCIGVWSKAQFQMLPWEGYAKKILSRGVVLSSLNYFCKITGRLLNQKLQFIV